MPTPKSKAKKKKTLAPSTSAAPAACVSHAWLAAAIAVLTFGVFLPALRNDFVRWDDYELLVDNLHFRGLGAQQLHWMFTTFHQGHYQPLSWITLAIDYSIWGMNPLGFHLTNIILHAVNAALFFYLADDLLARALPSGTNHLAVQISAAFAALFFAVHPLRVESVAWATERRDVLSGCFILATLICYVRAAAETIRPKNQQNRWFASSVIFYALSLLAKASGVTLPFILLILDIYPLRRIDWRTGKFIPIAPAQVWREKIPYALFALAAGIIAPLAQADAEAVASLRAHGFAARLAQSLYGLAFYLWKTVWPFDLSPLYEVPPRLDPLAWPFVLSGVIVVLVSAAAFSLRRNFPAGLASWVFYLTMVAPVLGWVQSGRQLVADRYSYLSCLAWALLIGAGFSLRSQHGQALSTGRGGSGVIAAGVIVLAGLSFLTVQQIAVWRDTDSLFTQVLAVTDRSFFRSATGHHFYARMLANKGDLQGAVAHLRSALEIDPASAEIYTDLGVYLGRRGELNEAVTSFEKALALNPDLSVSQFNLGNALALQGRFGEAIARLQAALRLRPDYPEAYNSLGKIYAAQGQLGPAIDQFRKAVAMQPEFIEARKNLVAALAENGKNAEAAQEMNELRRRGVSAAS